MHKALYAVATVLTMALWAKPAAAIQPTVLFNPHTNMCLEPQNRSTLQGTAIVQQPCDNSTAQEWLLIWLDPTVVQFKNVLTGMCLDARGSAANHTPVQQWTCNKITNEWWQPFPPAKGSTIAPIQSAVARSKGYCLDIPGGQSTAGLAMQIYKCNDTVSQLWKAII